MENCQKIEPSRLNLSELQQANSRLVQCWYSVLLSQQKSQSLLAQLKFSNNSRKKSAIIVMFIPYLDERMSNFKSNCSLQAANPSCVYAPIVCKLHLFPIEPADCHSVQSIATRHVLNLHNN